MKTSIFKFSALLFLLITLFTTTQCGKDGDGPHCRTCTASSGGETIETIKSCSAEEDQKFHDKYDSYPGYEVSCR